MAIYQLRFSSNGRLHLYPDEKHIRAAVHQLARVTRGMLVMFGFIFEHGHPLVIVEPNHIERLKKKLATELGAVAAEPMEEIWYDRVETRSHLLSLVRYTQLQTLNHGIPAHPATWSGSCFVDIVGARVVDGLELRLFEVLPALTREKLFEIVGLQPGCLRPASNNTIRAFGALRLRDAASAALAADPDLAGNDPPSARARCVVAHLAAVVGIPFSEVAFVLRITPTAVARLARREAEDNWVTATRLRLSLEEAVRDRIEQDWHRRVIEEYAVRKTTRLIHGR